VAYVRFASVYRRFEDIQAFRDLIEGLERDGAGDTDQRQISLLEARRDGRQRKK
jgi:transcriptional repressor NrdR